MRTCGLFLVWIVIPWISALPRDKLYPFGTEQSDQRLPVGDDISSNEIQLTTPIAFFDSVHKSIFVNINGHLSFESELPSFKSDLILPFGLKVIVPFYADIDTRLSGNVYYRQTADPSLLQKSQKFIHKHFPRYKSFKPKQLLIVTWDEVGYYREQFDRTNTFQVVIASDGRDSYSFFHYVDGGLNWITSEGKNVPQAPDVPGQAGFDAGDDVRSLSLPASGRPEVKNLASWSNVNEAGVWLFRIGKLGARDIPESPGANRPTVPPTRGPTVEKCATGRKDKCRSNAKCVDYQSGFCCECVKPAYGNGHNCLSPGVPQKVNGKVSGNINGIQISPVDLHAYVVTADGRTFIAISRMPMGLGYSLQIPVIGTIIGWLFALPTNPKARNGFMLTGGDLNRTLNVRFSGGKEVLTIKQTIKGQEALGFLRMTTTITGKIPKIKKGAKVQVADYKEEYKRESAGVVKASSTHTYTVDGKPYRYRWDETINYKECPHRPAAAETFKLSVSRSFVVFEERQQIVRYATTNKISSQAATDPCASATRPCDKNAQCLPTGSTYRCRCRAGFRGDGFRCQDIDECARPNDCNKNAVCINSDGSYDCRCKSGYRGDGRTCQRDMACGTYTCHANARCVYDYDTKSPKCECESGYSGDGLTCTAIEFSCNEVNNCDQNAQCVYDREFQKYQCECNDGFSGDGFSCSDTEDPEINCRNCDANAQCIYDLDRMIFRCQCKVQYTGDGNRCTRIEESCNVLNNCDRNAQCVLDRATRKYSCRCNQGFRGDGYRCEQAGCDVLRNCDVNARCLYDGANQKYACRCNPGFRGDGYTCAEEGCNVRNNCDANARCVYEDTRREYKCKCNTGFVGDGKTCQRETVPCNQVNNCDVNAECLYEPSTRVYQCRCKQGYTGDGYRCTTVSNCRRNPRICDRNARCEPRGTDYICVCRRGFRGDGRRCAPVGDSSSYLLYAQGMSIMQLPFSSTDKDKGKQVLLVPGQTAIGIDSDCYARYFYWTDVSGRTISRAKLDGTDSEVLVKGLGSPEGVAIDWVSKNMYWTDSVLDRIEVSRLEGKSRKTLITKGLVNPRGIQVDPVRGYLFWTDWNRAAPKVERSYMDGTNRKTVISSNLGLPNGLTLDHVNKKFCWGDAGTMHIECADYDGQNRRTIYSLASYPFDVTLANNIFFWTDWDQKAIPNINYFGRKLNKELPLAAGGNGRLYGITAVKPRCPAGTNACALNNGGCRFLCLPTPDGGRKCACPDDVDEAECNRINLIK